MFPHAHDRPRGFLLHGMVLFVALAGTAAGPSIPGVTALPDPGNGPDEFSGSSANPSYQRESLVNVTAATTLSFSTRYKALVSADSGLFGAARLEVLNSDYRINFTVVAPGAYR